MDDPLERVDRDVLERADLRGRRVGRRVDRGRVDEQVRDAPVDLDERERRLDLRPVGDVARVRADRALVERGAQARRRPRAASVSRSRIATRMPRAASATASSAPSCPIPPVTTATRPVRSKSGSLTARSYFRIARRDQNG